MNAPFFTVIAAHYQGSTSPAELDRFVASVRQPSGALDPSIELLIYHDGPLLEPSPHPIIATPARRNVSGHDLRRLGLREATGEWILHTNTDNVYAPGIFASLRAELERCTTDILITTVRMRGMLPGEFARQVHYESTRNPDVFMELSGVPPVFANIDLMQLVARRSLWLAHGWTTLTTEADAIIYESLTKKHPYSASPLVIGDHY